MRVLITGARGQLAHDLRRVFAEYDLLLLSREQLDICDNDQVQEVIGAARPDVVINTAAFVRVDDAEGEIAQSFAVNAGGAGQVARACADAGATLVQISTDYVYGGQEQREPLTEAVAAGAAQRLRRLETGRRIRGPGAVSTALRHP